MKKNTETKKGVKIVKSILSILFVVLSVMLVYLLVWAKYTFGNIPFAQVLFHLMVPLEGTDSSIISSYFYGVLPWVCLTLGIMIVIGVTHYLAADYFAKDNEQDSEQDDDQADNQDENEIEADKEESKKGIKAVFGKALRGVLLANRFLVRNKMRLASVILIIVLIVDVFGFGIHSWLIDRFDSSSLFEDYYVDASKANIKAPEKKKNLIYILSESLEASFTDFENGGCMDKNYMPNLTQLAMENTHFSRNESMAGAIEVEGTGWTIAAMVAQTSGVPLMLPIGRNGYGKYGEFLPGVTSLGEILEENGYVNEIIIGSNREFAGVDTYFEQHGDYEVYDLNTAIENGYVKEHNGFWGVDDIDVMKIARDEINELAAGDQPFSIIVNTIDLHTPSGYTCRECRYQTADKYKNVIYCQDRLIAEFVAWCKEQDFYEDTVIVVMGDHLSMAPVVNNEYMPDGYLRSTYNAIINSDLEAVNPTNRDFTTMDIFPTILASLGFEIEGDRLGLGTNLYSDKKTVMELVGRKKFMEEISKNSKLYNKDILGTR